MELFHGEPRVYDRGIVCARAYDALLKRPARSEGDYLYAEAMMRRSGAIYVFMDRDDFTHVRDDVNPGFDLQELSSIYKRILSTSSVRFSRFTVDDDTGAQPEKLLALLDDVITFGTSAGAIEEGEGP